MIACHTLGAWWWPLAQHYNCFPSLPLSAYVSRLLPLPVVPYFDWRRCHCCFCCTVEGNLDLLGVCHADDGAAFRCSLPEMLFCSEDGLAVPPLLYYPRNPIRCRMFYHPQAASRYLHVGIHPRNFPAAGHLYRAYRHQRFLPLVVRYQHQRWTQQ